MEPVRKERATDSDFAWSLYFASSTFARAVEKLAAECWKPSGLTPSQGNLLFYVIDNAYAFPYFISSDLRVNPSSVTRLADQLEAKGLIERVNYHHRTYLDATEKGLNLLPVLSKCANTFLSRSDELLGAGATSILTKSLNRATDKLTGEPRPETSGSRPTFSPETPTLPLQNANEIKPE